MGSEARSPLIVGSGIAGLYVALRAHEEGLRPTVVTKSGLAESNTRYAQGGIAAAIGPDDTTELHRRDTVRAGAGIADLAAVQVLTSEAPKRIADLVRYGVPFDTIEGRIALGREGGHSRARILHAGGDATGLQIEETLRARVLEAGIEARERCRLRALRPATDGTTTAVLSRDDGSQVEEVTGRPVVLATGGTGSLYRQSSNPITATGEGVAIAFRGGALVTDIEFIQFHPTVFAREGAPRFLITEALRGEGAVLRNQAGERFLLKYDPRGELATRDIVSRAIHQEMRKTEATAVFLDATAIPRDRLYARFPSVCRFLVDHGLDPSKDLIPVSPMAHYMVGGVTTDLEGRTSIPGLWACGEVASTGVHGANRLASNSLLEGMVFGERVARQLEHPSAGGPRDAPRMHSIELPPGLGQDDPEAAFREVGALLWDDVGIVRERKGLETAVRRFEYWRDRSEPPTDFDLASPSANAALTALLIARAALSREESRGAHFRSDFPRPSPRWKYHQGLRRARR
jgi:L-aspartate oxidase